MTRRRWLLLGLAGAALALLLGRGIAAVYTDYRWYAALGAGDLWSAKATALLVLRLLCAVVATLFVFANLYAVRQSVFSLVLPRRVGNLDIGEEVPRRQLTATAALLSAVIGVALAWSRSDWSGFLAARIGVPFSESDPYFAADLGFFVYRLPLELSLFHWLLTVVLLVIGLVIVLYALTPSLRWERGGLYVSGYVRRHFAMLAGALLILLAWHYRLQMFTLLGEGRSLDGGFGYLDHRVGIPANLLLSLVTLGAGLTVLWAGWTGQMRLAFTALTGVLVAVVAARQVAPFVVSRTIATSDPAVRDRPYHATRAGYTRRAFAVDQVQLADSAFSFPSLADAAPFVPIWDERALLDAADRPFPGAVVGWSMSDSAIIALVPTRAGGATISTFAASAAGDNGAPARLESLDARVTATLLVFPDSATRAVVIADSSGQLASPTLQGRLVRFAHALSMQDFRLWFGALPSPAPKLVSRRGVRERVEAVAPFFVQGNAITPVWSMGSLSWAVDLYAASSTYPLSRRFQVAGGERAYFQHAGTALVNASTGRTILVVDSLIDPITTTWLRRFPKLFVRAAALPMHVRRQLPPPREGARAQASAFGRYGLRGEREASRRLPDDEGADSALATTAPPFLAFPRAGTIGYVLPLLDASDRIRGLFVTLGGPSHRSLWIPADDTAPLWREALDRLSAADTIQAPQLVRGHVRAVPVAGRVTLVQPRYDWRGEGASRLLYVSATMGDSVQTARTLLQLAGRLPMSSPLGTADFRARVAELYEEMRRASARGDWAAYGRAFDALGSALARQRP